MLAETFLLLGDFVAVVVVDVCVPCHKNSSEKQRSRGGCLAASLYEMKLKARESDQGKQRTGGRTSEAEQLVHTAAAWLFPVSLCCCFLGRAVKSWVRTQGRPGIRALRYWDLLFQCLSHVLQQPGVDPGGVQW